ncbi:KH domain-containing protein At4g18375-like [Typha latifolia]|uniref:KH domain-containing protein At4g18375-like n=1 Tax=Typha latifolia TaxID=4733 RepID=UPI003C2D87A3
MDGGKYGKRKSSTFRKPSRPHFDDKKRKRLSSGHNDGSMSSKPIDTLYRILCPVKKIGSVLGKGGDIINALRDETHAKIRVADAIPGAEERVVIIFNYLSKQSGESDSDQEPDSVNAAADEPENIKPHCPAQDALLKVNNRITSDEVLHGGVMHEKNEPDDEVTARILVPNNQVGCLLGKGGTIIQKLRSDTGASIRILPSEHLPPCAMSSDELVQISGMPSVMTKALYEISTRLHQHPHKENPPLEDLIYASTRGLHESSGSMPPPLPQGNSIWSHQYGGLPPPTPWFDGHREPSGFAFDGYKSGRFNREITEEFSVRMLCASGKIGGVIGKGGVSVRHLEQQTGARIQIEDTAPEAGERVIVISSKEVPSDPISPTIEALLMLQRKASATSENDVVTTRLLVPSSKVGCIIGQGGNIITEMRRRTRADIRVYSKEDKPKYTSADEELVQISGNPVVASEALKEITSRLRTRTFRSGTAAVSPTRPDPFYGFPPEHMPNRGLPPSGSPASFRGFPLEHMPNRGLPPSRSPPHFHGYPPSDRMPTRGLPQSVSPAINSAPMGSFREYAPPESFSNRGLPSSGMSRAGNSSGYDHLKGAGQMYEAQRYPGPPTATGYPNINSSVEIRIPNSAVASVIGAGGSTLSDIRQISGARIKLRDPLTSASECIVEIHGTPDQTKAAESLLQAFIASSMQNMQRSEAPRLYQPSAWS